MIVNGYEIRPGANLRRANLRHADLESADLGGANLEGADLWHANLWHANLRRANLRHADLESANLRHADLEGANLEGVKLPDDVLYTWMLKTLHGIVNPIWRAGPSDTPVIYDYKVTDAGRAWMQAHEANQKI